MTTEETRNLVWGFGTAGKIKFGPGVAGDVGAEARDLGGTRALVVSDRVLSELGVLAEVVGHLEAHGLETCVWSDFQSEPRTSDIERCRDAADADVDLVVGVGGGSALDIAKAVSLILKYGEPVQTYIPKPFGDGKPIPGAGIPMIAVPTTSGTGSEATKVAVMSVGEGDSKTGIGHPGLFPNASLVDPVLTATLPPRATAVCGFDALCHAVEAFTGKRFDQFARASETSARPAGGGNPVTDILSSKAIALVAGALRKAVNHGSDLAARSEMSLASLLAGMSIANAGTTVPHGLGTVIGGLYHLPHGLACGVILPYFADYACRADFLTFSKLTELLSHTPIGSGDDPAFWAAHAGTLICDLMADVGLPTTLEGVGVKEQDLPMIAQAASRNRGMFISRSPRIADEQGLMEILEAAYEGRLGED